MADDSLTAEQFEAACGYVCGYVVPAGPGEMAAGFPMPLPNLPADREELPGGKHRAGRWPSTTGPDPGEPAGLQCPVSVFAGSFGHVRCGQVARHGGQHSAVIRWAGPTGYRD